MASIRKVFEYEAEIYVFMIVSENRVFFHELYTPIFLCSMQCRMQKELVSLTNDFTPFAGLSEAV